MQFDSGAGISMRKKLVVAWKRAFGLHFPGHNLRVFPDDIFFVSYPKSGNTWVRFLVANLVYPEKNPDFSNIDFLLPDPEGMAKKNLERALRPRILKSHLCFDPRYPKVLYVVRDPRDVVLSSYHFDLKRRAIPEGYSLQEFVSRFIAGELIGHNPRYGTWHDNVASWHYARRNDPRFLLVTYESLQAQAIDEMKRIASFLGVPADSERLAFAVEQSSARRMRELEKKQGHLWNSTRETQLDKPFVRAAKSGGWKSELPPASVTEIESKWGELMQEMGYEISAGKLAHAGMERS
jgi:hypothetical protein